MSKTPSEKFWFKRRRYGYGWIPVTWQGWLVLVGFIGAIAAGAFSLKKSPQHHLSNEDVGYIFFVFLAVIALTVVALKKGPRPKWRWGKTSHDNSDEDF